MPKPWFTDQAYTSLEITKQHSIAVHTTERTLTIQDSEAIQQFMRRIQQLPAQGDMMKSFGPDAAYIKLTFKNEQNTHVLEIIQKKFKTPSTGFNSGNNEKEIALYQDIEALLFPDVNKRLLKIKKLELKFPAFSITYLSNEFRDLAPATLSFTTDIFLVTEENKEQRIEIPSGQLPPAPFIVKTKQAEYVLLTFDSSTGERLYPAYCQLIKK